MKSLSVALALSLPDRGSAKAAQRANCRRGYFCIFENVNFGSARLDMGSWHDQAVAVKPC